MQFKSPARTRKATHAERLYGIKTPRHSVQELKARVVKKLGLTFEMDEWQSQVIYKVKSGYDSIVVAGTGYGKSIIFEGLAAADKGKMVVVISPLKALERDQVSKLNLLTATPVTPPAR